MKTPKEKALELIEIFTNETDGIAAYDYSKVYIECAKRCAEQILKHNPAVYRNHEYEIDRKFWNEVISVLNTL